MLLACALLRTWLIQRSEIISKDGTIYVRMAREWSDGPRAVVDNYAYHVGYPAAMNAVHRAISKLGGPGGIDGWELSGRIVSLVSSLAAMVGIWVLAGWAFNGRVAWITVLLFGVGQKWAHLGSDAISDALAVCLQVWTVAIAVTALNRLTRGSWRALAWAAGAGLCAGCGYLVRPEALVSAAMACLLWLGWQIRRRGSWRLTLSAIAVAGIATLAAAAPYMIAIGGLTKKKSITDIVLGLMQEGIPLAGAVGEHSPWKFTGQLSEAAHPVIAILICLWLVTWVAVRVFRLRLPPGVLVTPRPEGGFLMVLGVALISPIMISLYLHVGYLSHRHVTFLAAMIVPLAGAVIAGMAEAAAALSARFGRRLRPGMWLAVIVAAFVIPMAIRTGQRTHEGQGCFREAGEYLAAAAGPQDWVLADSAYILHYSGARGDFVDLRTISAKRLLRFIREHNPGPTYLVLSSSGLARGDEVHAQAGEPPLETRIRPPIFTLVREFTRGGHEGETIRVYRIDRAILEGKPGTQPGGELAP